MPKPPRKFFSDKPFEPKRPAGKRGGDAPPKFAKPARKAAANREEPAPAMPSKPKAKAKPKPEPVPVPPPPAPVEEVANVPDPVAFAELGLSEPVARAVGEMGFETATPIQAHAIPVLLEGKDVLGLAQTGTGKTAAFAIPLIMRIDPTRRDVQALVMAPTRELAVQVAGGIYDLAKHTGLRVVPVYGGAPIDRQIRALRDGAQIVVGTPGRIQDHIRRGSLKLENVSYCVLDEADEMLTLGFFEDIEAILSELPEERQTAFFSATMPPRIADLTQRFLREPVRVEIESKQRTVDTTNQSYYEVPHGKKLEALARILDMETPGSTIIFCRTRKDTQELSEALRLRGYNAEPLHGDMGQPERDRVMRKFREGHADLLIATDVAARGLDVESVTHVINFDIPWDVEQYIHRIGRTGRAGRTGDAITLVEGKERRQLKFIERMIGAAIKPARMPSVADIAARRREIFRDTLREALEASAFDGHLVTVEELSHDYDPTEIAAAALQLLWQERHNGPLEVEEELAANTDRTEQGMVRIFIGIGRQDGLRPGAIVAAIANEAGLDGRQIGSIDILDRTAFVEVPAEHADRVIDVLSATKIRGRRVKVQRAFDDAGGRGAGGR